MLRSRKERQYARIVAAVATFFLLALVTNPVHDWFFWSHTSIQDGVEVCDGYGDCWTEDGVRAYQSTGWAILGHTVALGFLLLRLGIGYYVYMRLFPEPK